ncbi:hypothetical protein ES705_46862 [subsurface metagenome]
MKRKYFLVVLFLILAIFLSGCGIITDESKVRNVIDEYFLAMNAQDWDKAKSYCIYGPDVYYETCDFEEYIDDLWPSTVEVIFIMDVFDITITGNYARAYIDGSLTIIRDGQSITNDDSGYLYLQKVNNNWKLCGWK